MPVEVGNTGAACSQGLPVIWGYIGSATKLGGAGGGGGGSAGVGCSQRLPVIWWYIGSVTKLGGGGGGGGGSGGGCWKFWVCSTVCTILRRRRFRLMTSATTQIAKNRPPIPP